MDGHGPGPGNMDGHGPGNGPGHGPGPGHGHGQTIHVLKKFGPSPSGLFVYYRAREAIYAPKRAELYPLMNFTQVCRKLLKRFIKKPAG